MTSFRYSSILAGTLMAAGILFSGVPQAAAAAQAGPTRIAILDVQQLMRNSSAGRSAAKQLSVLQKRYEKEIASAENKLRAERNKLVQEQSKLSAQDFDKRRQAFQHDVAAAQRLVQERNGEMDAAMQNARKQIGKIVIGIVTGIMKKDDIGVVIDRQQIVASQTSLEITGEVMKVLNQKLPKIRVSTAGFKVPPGHEVRRLNGGQLGAKGGQLGVK